jgi:hypothetical protein
MTESRATSKTRQHPLGNIGGGGSEQNSRIKVGRVGGLQRNSEERTFRIKKTKLRQ